MMRRLFKPLPKLAEVINEGEMIPNGYGIWYYRPERRDRVVVLMPLNVPARLLYIIWLWLLFPFRGWEPPWWRRKARSGR